MGDMMKERILIVEDEKAIQKILMTYLENANYTTYVASDGMEGYMIYNQVQPDMVIVDVMMPKLNGYELCKLIRSEADIPIIMLTALGSEEDQIKGFDYLIDDYIVKPFSMSLLLKRVEAVFRRQTTKSFGNILTYKDLAIDLDGHTAYINKEEVILTTKEFEILKLFLQNPGRVYTREMIYELLWGDSLLGAEKLINTHIGNIRKKLNRDYIQTVRGVGYKIEKKTDI